jgi:hypothetical protein
VESIDVKSPMAFISSSNCESELSFWMSKSSSSSVFGWIVGDVGGVVKGFECEGETAGDVDRLSGLDWKDDLRSGGPSRERGGRSEGDNGGVFDSRWRC